MVVISSMQESWHTDNFAGATVLHSEIVVAQRLQNYSQRHRCCALLALVVSHAQLLPAGSVEQVDMVTCYMD